MACDCGTPWSKWSTYDFSTLCKFFHSEIEAFKHDIALDSCRFNKDGLPSHNTYPFTFVNITDTDYINAFFLRALSFRRAENLDI